jgi:tetratricopeptide (TPR) repeat protein
MSTLGRKGSLIIIFMTLLQLLLFAVSWPQRGEDSIYAELDKFYAGRDEVGNLQRAEALLAARIKGHPTEYESLWRAGRIHYCLAEAQKEKNAKLKYYEAGVEVSIRASKLKPERPEGHFWLAANLGSSAELKGIWASLRSLSTIRSEFEKVIEIAPTYDFGNAYLALAEINLRLPGFMGGNDQKGIALLEKGLLLFPDNHNLKLTLASAYSKKSRKPEACKLLQLILESTDPQMTPRELAEARSQARKQLEPLQ